MTFVTYSELVIHHNDNVSDLGESGYFPGFQQMYDGQSLTTKGFEAMLDAKTIANNPGTLSGMEEPGECYDVALPAGKAGILLVDDPETGLPVVHQVNKTSPLHGQVEKGDVLVSLEGNDCTNLTAAQVARKLQSNDDVSSRVVTFSRGE